MKNMITIENILNNIDTREQLIERVEILDKVKKLLLMPGMTFTTMNSVAEYYETNYDTVKLLVKRHKEEFEKDGLLVLNKKTFLEKFYKGQDVTYKIESTRASVTAIFDDDKRYTFTNRGSYIFNKRTILRVGMLLTESKIAEEVRTQLLNIEENASNEIKVQEIDTELSMIGQALSTAFINNDIDSFAKLSMELNAYQNRHRLETIKALEDKIKSLSTMLQAKEDELEKIIKENKLLISDLSYIPNHDRCREAVKSMITRLRIRRGFSSEWLCWKEVYTIIRNKYGIDLTARKYSTPDSAGRSMISFVTEEEWPNILSVVAALCYRYNADIEDLISDLKKLEAV